MSEIGMAKIQNIGQIVRVRVANCEGRQTPTVFYKFEDGSMIKHFVRDIASPRPWRNHHAGHAEAQPPITPQGLLGWLNLDGRGWDMIKEATPFVKIDDQNGVRPIGTRDDRIIDACQKRFSIPNVRMRVVIISTSIAQMYGLKRGGEHRIDEGDGGQIPERAVLVETVHSKSNGRIFEQTP